jgi:hypothetical protein
MTIFFGGQSGSGNCSDNSTGNQNRRSNSPMAVPAPLSVRNLLSSARSMARPPGLVGVSTEIDAAEARRQRNLFSRRWRARVVMIRPPRKRGRGECRVPVAPAASCVKNKTHELVTTVAPVKPGIPARNGFNAYIALSPVTGLVCHRRLRKLPSAKLDASVGASGPHDFAVRKKAPSSEAQLASTASRAQRP